MDHVAAGVIVGVCCEVLCCLVYNVPFTAVKIFDFQINAVAVPAAVPAGY